MVSSNLMISFLYIIFFPNQGKNISREHIVKVIKSSNSRITSRALYFHIPFCETICSFCPFVRGGYKASQIVDKYTKAVIREIEIKSFFNDYHAIPVRSIFLEVALLHLLSPDNMFQFGQAIGKHFLLSSDCEFLFEIEVKSLTEEKVIVMKDMGVSHRLCLQTFDTTGVNYFI